jgi:hypothetical protein
MFFIKKGKKFNMIYMVEMNLMDLSRRNEWDEWYLKHTKMLLTFRGFHATQRFESLYKVDAPFVAMHHVDGLDFFNSAPYKNHAGPLGTGEWRTKMNNWNRNLFKGLNATPEVKMSEFLILIEEKTKMDYQFENEVVWLKSCGLDMTVEYRGLAVVSSLDNLKEAERDPTVRVLKPLMKRLTKEEL